MCKTFLWYLHKCLLMMGIGKNVENHVQENAGWTLFKTHNFYVFLRYTVASSKCEFGSIIMYNMV